MKNYILFDFDGVIADSYSVAFDVQKKICPNITEEEYKKRFEGNINNWKHKDNFHTAGCHHDIDFFKEYIPRMKNEVDIVHDMKEVIIELEKDYVLIIISSTITSPIEDFLRKHELYSHFDWVMGNDVHKSKVEKIKMVFERYNTKAENCVFITDTLGDMREAQEMNVTPIGVAWGFHDKETLQKGNPIKIVHLEVKPLSVAEEKVSFK